ncbi:hypothetical protein [Prochlorococcus marinus]|uniref:hypothetical protein n=1 Tax=Prochlorococcus marinus TaxID=1219 RepID=UPI001ADD1968|nr:hypothetical protein [Prochlorococcus marinus]MBO8219390.1 hypothetical protein [Prochlorococcus marinus CUG1416]MBW3051769.1 hypothetical protein [Prochlorococcus marinus str. MU1416]
MNIKFITILFIGLISSFIGEIKAEDICYFSNPKEYKKCFNKKSSLKRQAKYPLVTYSDGWDIKWISGNGVNGPHATPGAIFKIIELNAPNSKQLKITIGDKRTNIMGITRKAPFISAKQDIQIDSEDILSWNTAQPEYEVFNKLSYLNDYGDKKDLNFRNFNFSPKKRRLEFMNQFFTKLSGLKKGENREIDSVILNKMNRHMKELEIMRSIIKVASTEKDCFIAKQSKFPELTEKYKKLYKTVNPLRSKLDLPPNADLKPICS